CELKVTPDALKAIARKALSQRTGARGLRAILEDLLLQSRYEVPGSDISSVVITEDAVLGREQPEYQYRPRSSSASRL
ncbi:ATP-dependent Clp protease ATP-binding subunit clpX mitochondrial, partial [Fasciolopsis buskii]